MRTINQVSLDSLNTRLSIVDAPIKKAPHPPHPPHPPIDKPIDIFDQSDRPATPNPAHFKISPFFSDHLPSPQEGHVLLKEIYALINGKKYQNMFTEKERIVFIAHFIKDNSSDEIAKELRLSQGRVQLIIRGVLSKIKFFVDGSKRDPFLWGMVKVAWEQHLRKSGLDFNSWQKRREDLYAAVIKKTRTEDSLPKKITYQEKTFYQHLFHNIKDRVLLNTEIPTQDLLYSIWKADNHRLPNPSISHNFASIFSTHLKKTVETYMKERATNGLDYKTYDRTIRNERINFRFTHRHLFARGRH